MGLNGQFFLFSGSELAAKRAADAQRHFVAEEECKPFSIPLCRRMTRTNHNEKCNKFHLSRAGNSCILREALLLEKRALLLTRLVTALYLLLCLYVVH